MNTVFLSLGSNTGDRVLFIRHAREMINLTIGEIIKASSLYETESWGKEIPLFINQLIFINTALSASEILKKTLKIEADLGRLRSSEKYDSRTIDIDIIFYNDSIIESSELTIPHPLLHLRNFILVPLREIAAEFIHPLLGQNPEQMMQNCTDNKKVRRLENTDKTK